MHAIPLQEVLTLNKKTRQFIFAMIDIAEI